VIEVPDFDRLYVTDSDPYRVGTSFYEQRKLDVVMAVLARATYGAAWDPACGTGHLAAAVAPRCRSVLATDLSSAAITIARGACAGLNNVVFRQYDLPSRPPVTGPFDLTFLAEFLYYLDDDDRAAAFDLVVDFAAPRAEVVAVHWRQHPHDAYASGAQVQEEVVRRLHTSGWRTGVHVEDPVFVLDSLLRGGSDE